MFMQELYHHGIKGMKWGVRRTPEQLGHPRKRKPVSLNEMDRKHRFKMFNSGRDFVMSKDEPIYRITNHQNVEKGRLYVSALWPYSLSDIDAIGGTVSADVYEKRYKLNKDVSVAGTNTQLKLLSKITGNMDYKNLIKDPGLLYKKSIDLDVLNKDTPLRSKYIQELQKKGYDFAYDLVDGFEIGYHDAPFVVLDSEKILGEEYVKKIFDKDLGLL